jgi:L-threonylcarbamoyladenylate synthase
MLSGAHVDLRISPVLYWRQSQASVRKNMQIITSDVLLSKRLHVAVECLRSGGLVVFPTDTLYGLGAAVSDDEAMGRLFKAKKRAAGMALPILLSEESEMERVGAPLPDLALQLASRFWPGPLTLVLRRNIGFRSLALAGRDDVAVRVPDHPIPRALIRALGEPITGTSANLSGRAPPATAEDAAEQLGESVDIIIDGGRTPIGVESTVIDLVGERPRLLREGAITRAQIEAVVGRVVVSEG